MDACTGGDVIPSIPFFMAVLMDYIAIDNSRNHRNHSSAMVTDNAVNFTILNQLKGQE
jgi:hypothetical protein